MPSRQCIPGEAPSVLLVTSQATASHLAYSALASFRMGISGQASFQRNANEHLRSLEIQSVDFLRADVAHYEG